MKKEYNELDDLIKNNIENIISTYNIQVKYFSDQKSILKYNKNI